MFEVRTDLALEEQERLQERRSLPGDFCPGGGVGGWEIRVTTCRSKQRMQGK